MDEPVDVTLARTVSVFDRDPVAAPLGLTYGRPFLFALRRTARERGRNRWTEGEIDALRRPIWLRGRLVELVGRLRRRRRRVSCGGGAADGGWRTPGSRSGPETARDHTCRSQRSVRVLGRDYPRRMFTGIVRELGIVETADGGPEGLRLRVRAPQAAAQAALGDSVALSGACLTVTEVIDDTLSSDAVPETLARTSLGRLSRRRAQCRACLRAGEPLGGHMVQAMSTGWGGAGHASRGGRGPPGGGGAAGAPALLRAEGLRLRRGRQSHGRRVRRRSFTVALIPHASR